MEDNSLIPFISFLNKELIDNCKDNSEDLFIYDNSIDSTIEVLTLKLKEECRISTDDFNVDISFEENYLLCFSNTLIEWLRKYYKEVLRNKNNYAYHYSRINILMWLIKTKIYINSNHDIYLKFKYNFNNPEMTVYLNEVELYSFKHKDLD